MVLGTSANFYLIVTNVASKTNFELDNMNNHRAQGHVVGCPHPEHAYSLRKWTSMFHVIQTNCPDQASAILTTFRCWRQFA